MGTQPAQSGYRVSGAGEGGASVWNGDYIETGTYSSHPYYLKDGSNSHALFYGGGGWYLCSFMGSPPYYFVSSQDSLPALTGWETILGEEPPPTLSIL